MRQLLLAVAFAATFGSIECVTAQDAGVVPAVPTAKASFHLPAFRNDYVTLLNVYIHQTGRADFRHPAFRSASPRSTRRRTGCKRVLCSTFPLLHPLIQQPRTVPVVDGVARLIANRLDLPVVGSAPKVRVLSSAGVTRPRQSYDPVRLPSEPPPESDVEAATLAQDGPPLITCITFSTCRAQYPGGSRRVHLSITSPFARPSPE